MRALLSWMSKGLAALVLALTVATGAAFAQATAESPHAKVTILFERSAATPGDTFLGALKFDLADKWHVYWRNPGDSGLPPEASWTETPGVTFGDFRFPVPHAIPLATLMNYGYEHELVLLFQIKIAEDAKPGSEIPIAGKIDYLICADICIPESVSLSTTLKIAATPEADATGGAIIAEVLPHIPVALSGKATVERTAKGFRISAVDTGVVGAIPAAKEIRFFPDGPEVSNPAKQTVKTGAEGVSIEVVASDFAKEGDQAVNGIIAIIDGTGSARGWEIQSTPGPLPPGVNTASFVNAAAGAGEGGAASNAAAPVMGFTEILFTLGLAFLGGLVLNLMPCVLPVLTIKAAGLVHTAHNPKESRAHGVAYTAGVVVCFAAIGAILLALRAAGEQAGLGFQLQYPPITAIFALIMFAVGLNLLGVFEMGGSLMGVGSGLAERGGTSGAFFTGLLAAFVGAPCVGPFMAPAFATALAQPAPIVMATFIMVGFGLAAPFLLLSFTPAFAKILPKPGRWMETFRQVLAFPMFITVLWLLWVLAGQSDAEGVIAVLAGAIALGFGIWLAKKIGQGSVGRAIAALVILAAFIAPAAWTVWPKQEAEASAATIAANAWSPEKVVELQGEGRVIFVDFTARWCVTCQFNKGAMHDPSVAKTFTDLNVAFLEADWTKKDKVIADELAKHGAAGVPLYLVYPANGGAPQKLDQILTPGMIEQAVRQAAGSL